MFCFGKYKIENESVYIIIQKIQKYNIYFLKCCFKITSKFKLYTKQTTKNIITAKRITE